MRLLICVLAVAIVLALGLIAGSIPATAASPVPSFTGSWTGSHVTVRSDGNILTGSFTFQLTQTGSVITGGIDCISGACSTATIKGTLINSTLVAYQITFLHTGTCGSGQLGGTIQMLQDGQHIYVTEGGGTPDCFTEHGAATLTRQ